MDTVVAKEEHLPSQQFCHDAAHRPDVHCTGEGREGRGGEGRGGEGRGGEGRGGEGRGGEGRGGEGRGGEERRGERGGEGKGGKGSDRAQLPILSLLPHTLYKCHMKTS